MIEEPMQLAARPAARANEMLQVAGHLLLKRNRRESSLTNAS